MAEPMTTFERLVMECETDGAALVAKLRRLGSASQEYRDHPTTSRLYDMAQWLDDIVDDLARIGGHPRSIPDYYEEVER